MSVNWQPNRPLLRIVWSRDLDPSPEFYAFAEPGRTLIRKKKSFSGTTELKVVKRSGTGDRSSVAPFAGPSSLRSPGLQTSGRDPLSVVKGFLIGMPISAAMWVGIVYGAWKIWKLFH